ALDLQDRYRRQDRADPQPASGRALSAGQHLHGARRLPQRRLDDRSARRGCEGPLRRPQAGLGRPLPAPAWNHRQGRRGAVPPRRLQPAPLGPVLSPRKSASKRRGRRVGLFCFLAQIPRIFAENHWFSRPAEVTIELTQTPLGGTECPPASPPPRQRRSPPHGRLPPARPPRRSMRPLSPRTALKSARPPMKRSQCSQSSSGTSAAVPSAPPKLTGFAPSRHFTQPENLNAARASSPLSLFANSASQQNSVDAKITLPHASPPSTMRR